MSKKMLINAALEGESRLAIVEGQELLELFIERQSHGPHVGDIFLAKIVNIEPSIQAAFVDFGWPKNGFLHVSDIHPSCYAQKAQGKGRDKPPIQQVMKRGQTVLVQMVKYGVGSKGPAMTTYISIPGRYMVLMPALKRLGVSRKIEDDATRKKLRKMLDDIVSDNELGVIVRTAGIDRTKTELKSDLSYLKRLWKNIQQRVKQDKPPTTIYQERDLAIRGIRDFYTSDISEIVIDSPEVRERVEEFLTIVPKRQQPNIKTHTEVTNLFEHYRIEQEIHKMYSRKVDLPGGGHIVIDQAEALVAIDINSGSFRASKDPEENLYQLNLIAAREIARQIRLRDLGGMIVIDFVDLKSDKRIRAIEKAFADEFKKDKARTKVLRMSKFCILQMTRQRMRPSLESSIYRTCPYCEGTGSVKNIETMALEFFRTLRSNIKADHGGVLTVRLNPEVASHLLNERRRELYKFEQNTGYQVVVLGDVSLPPERIQVSAEHQKGAKPAPSLEAEDERRLVRPGENPVEPPAIEAVEEAEQAEAEEKAEQEEEKPSKSKRRRRRRKKKPAESPEATTGREATVEVVGTGGMTPVVEPVEAEYTEAEATIEVIARGKTIGIEAEETRDADLYEPYEVEESEETPEPVAAKAEPRPEPKKPAEARPAAEAKPEEKPAETKRPAEAAKAETKPEKKEPARPAEAKPQKTEPEKQAGPAETKTATPPAPEPEQPRSTSVREDIRSRWARELAEATGQPLPPEPEPEKAPQPAESAQKKPAPAKAPRSEPAAEKAEPEPAETKPRSAKSEKSASRREPSRTPWEAAAGTVAVPIEELPEAEAEIVLLETPEEEAERKKQNKSRRPTGGRRKSTKKSSRKKTAKKSEESEPAGATS
jgi:ribonuclease E